jgi:hypothetical protein
LDSSTGDDAIILRATDLDDPLADLRRFGIDAELAWSADFDGDGLVLVRPEPENLIRLERWLGTAHARRIEQPIDIPRRLAPQPG